MNYFIQIYTEDGERSEIKRLSDPNEVIKKVSQYKDAGIKNEVFSAELVTDNS